MINGDKKGCLKLSTSFSYLARSVGKEVGRQVDVDRYRQIRGPKQLLNTILLGSLIINIV